MEVYAVFLSQDYESDILECIFSDIDKAKNWVERESASLWEGQEYIIEKILVDEKLLL